MRPQILTLLMFSSFILVAQNYNWSTLKTGAGGWITGMDIHPTGQPIYARSDVGSAYKFNANTNEWTNIVTAENLPEIDVYWNRYGGVLSIVSAPSNSNRAYMAYFDAIFTSSNQGLNWTKTNFPQLDLSSNYDDSKLSGERLAVDPINENVVYFGSPNNGLFKTTDGGLTWDVVTFIPNGIENRGVRQIIFDTSNGSTNNKTNTIYVTVDGVGVFKTTNAGLTWINSNLPVTSPILLDSEIDTNGNLYCVGRDSNDQTFGIQKYNGSVWTSIQNNGTTYLNIAIDPFNPNQIIALSEGFLETAVTTSANLTTPNWSYPTRTLSSNSIPWISWTVNNWFTIGEMTFDPVVPNKLWISDGIGVWNVNEINSNELVWVEISQAQEHLVSNDLVINQNGKVITAHWDRPLFFHDNLNEYPNIHQPSNRFNSAWDMDVSPVNRNFIVSITEDHRYCCYDDEHRNSGYSADGGLTWSKFPTQPDASNPNGIFGNIAVSATDNNTIVWLPTGNQNPYYTNNLGESWQQGTLPNNQGNCCLNFNFVYKKALVADQVLPNTFYIYNWENGSINVSTNGGATWTERTALQDYFGWNAKISATPGQAGHLWYSHGAEQAISFMKPLKRSLNGGLTWQTLDNTSEVLNHAIGAPLPNSTYPTLFIQGRVNGNFGYWMSSDQGVNWSQIGVYPNGIYDIAKVMEGDPFIPTRLYVGFGGNGFVYGQDDSVLSTDEPILNKSKLLVYPNPAHNLLHVEYTTIMESLEVFNYLGQLVMQLQPQKNKLEINIGKFNRGIYFLVINKKEKSKLVIN